VFLLVHCCCPLGRANVQVHKQMLTHVPRLQWISEVLHFCQGLPIILVGCKKDLRYDPKVTEELRKTSQKPVTAEEVSPDSFAALAAASDMPPRTCLRCAVSPRTAACPVQC